MQHRSKNKGILLKSISVSRMRRSRRVRAEIPGRRKKKRLSHCLKNNIMILLSVYSVYSKRKHFLLFDSIVKNNNNYKTSNKSNYSNVKRLFYRVTRIFFLNFFFFFCRISRCIYYDALPMFFQIG